MDYNDIDDFELASLISENDENVRNIIYKKYNYLIELIINKYHRFIIGSKVDMQEFKSEALYGFSDGINSYSPDKCASLKTFLYLCIERRIQKYLRSALTGKNQILKESLSLDYVTNESGISLVELLGDNKNNPLNNITDLESSNEIILLAKNNLSKFEYTVFVYMINSFSYNDIAKILEKSPKQIDNAIQRIKIKMRNLMQKNGLI